MTYQISERLRRLPPYPFVELDRLKSEAIARGADIINLGIGDPDLPTPKVIIDALTEAANDPANHQYPLGAGMIQFRKEVSSYYARTRQVDVDPATEVCTLIGSKEGIAHFPLAFLNPGDVALVPDPGYPVYHSATIFAGGEPYAMPLLAENGFLPDLDAIPDAVYARTKLMFLNYPNNPTAALAPAEFFEKAIAKAKKHGFAILHDAAYLDMVYHGVKPLSFLEIPGGKEVGIELHSLSKTFNMTGWRIGYAVGNKSLVQGLLNLKTNVDSGVFGAIQKAGMVALQNYESLMPGLIATYEARLKVLNDGIRSLGWRDFTLPKATFYVWIRNQSGLKSIEMVKTLIQECGIVTTPGTAFGQSGEGYFRIALTTSKERISEAITRLSNIAL